MLRSGLTQRWMVAATVALALMATATTTTATNCNVTESDSASGSASDSADSGDSADFSTIDYDDGEAATHQGCFEVALWCESLGTAVSPDPDNNCEYPCPDITRGDAD